MLLARLPRHLHDDSHFSTSLHYSGTAAKLAYRTLTTLAAAEFVVYEVSQVAIIAFG